jgi:hypothetical protein
VGVFYNHQTKGEDPMNNKVARITLFAAKINRQHIQLVIALLALAMLVLGVGAPSAGGGAGPH